MKTETDRPQQTSEDVLKELRSLVSEAERILGERPGGYNRDLTAATLRERLQTVQERLSLLYQGAREKVVTGAKRTDETIREHPYRSLAVALGVGFLVGIFVGRRGNSSSQ